MILDATADRLRLRLASGRHRLAVGDGAPLRRRRPTRRHPADPDRSRGRRRPRPRARDGAEPAARPLGADRARLGRRPQVADLKVITPTQLLLTARGVGSTDLTLWNKKDEPLVLALSCPQPRRAPQAAQGPVPGENITVSAAGDLVVLSGEASDVRVPERAAEVAQLHAEQVANLIRVSGNQQVQLEVKFAEVSRNGLREMGFNFFHSDDRAGGFVGRHGAPSDFAARIARQSRATGAGGSPAVFPPPMGSAFSLFFSGLPNFPFSAMLSLLEQNGLSKTLAEPTLVAMSGQEAKFLAGGEFPIPMPTGLGHGRRPVEEVRHHPQLHARPSSARAHPPASSPTEVSDIDASPRAVTVGGFNVPGAHLAPERDHRAPVATGRASPSPACSRTASARRSTRCRCSATSRSWARCSARSQYRRDETELLVVVTARLTKPVAPHEVPRLPTDDELERPERLRAVPAGERGQGARRARRRPATSATVRAARSAPRAALRGRGPSGELGFIR